MNKTKNEWIVSMRVADKKKKLVIHKAKIECLTEALAETIKRIIDDGTEAIEAYEVIKS